MGLSTKENEMTRLKNALSYCAFLIAVTFLTFVLPLAGLAAVYVFGSL